MVWALLALLGCLSPIRSEFGRAHHGASSAYEVFTLDNTEYSFYSTRTSWDEAEAICESARSELAVINNSKKAKFIADTMAETWGNFEDLWIGGRKTKKGWQWIKSDKYLLDQSQQESNYNFSYPPWADNMEADRVDRLCLAIDRTDHTDPFFVDLSCEVPRSFICETVKQDEGLPIPSLPVQILGTSYVLYHGRLSWSYAVSFCRQQGMQLASVTNETVSSKLAKHMLRSRPEFEDAWIGLSKNGEVWQWVSDSSPMESIYNEYGDELLYPPWVEAPRPGNDCVVLDRHLAKQPKFKDMKCSRQRDFICMKPDESLPPPKNSFSVPRKDKMYTFHPSVRLSFREAKSLCEDSDSTMLRLTDLEQTRFIVEHMADSKEEMDHIWIGGELIDDKWVWVKVDNDGPDVEISNTMDEFGFPPWYDSETILPEMNCLNLDRQNHWTASIYGLQCNTTQAVVCCKNISLSDIYLDNNIAVSNGSGKILSWQESKKLCKEEMGDFAIVENPVSFFKSTQLRIFLGTTWSVEEKKWKWPDGSTLEVPSEVLLSGNASRRCLLLDTTNGSEIYEPIPCHQKFSGVQIACRGVCLRQQDFNQDVGGKWSCDWIQGKLFDEKIIGKHCRHRCDKGYILYGSPTFKCTELGWVGEARLQPNNGHCSAISDSLVEIASRIEEKNVTNLAFAFDTSAQSNPDLMALFRYAAFTLIDFIMSKLSIGTVHSIPFASQYDVLNVTLPDTTNLCESIGNLLQRSSGSFKEKSSYLAPLQAVQNIFRTHSRLFTTAIVFLIAGPNQWGSFKDIGFMVAKRAGGVYALGVNSYKTYRLSQLATATPFGVNILGYASGEDLKEATKNLAETCEQCKCKAEAVELLAGSKYAAMGKIVHQARTTTKEKDKKKGKEKENEKEAEKEKEKDKGKQKEKDEEGEAE